MDLDEQLQIISNQLREIMTSSLSLIESEKDDVISQLIEVLKKISYFRD